MYVFVNEVVFLAYPTLTNICDNVGNKKIPQVTKEQHHFCCCLFGVFHPAYVIGSTPALLVGNDQDEVIRRK